MNSKLVDVSALIAAALIFCTTIGGAVYLAVTGHPWMGLAVLLFGSLVRIRTGKAAESE